MLTTAKTKCGDDRMRASRRRLGRGLWGEKSYCILLVEEGNPNKNKERKYERKEQILLIPW